MIRKRESSLGPTSVLSCGCPPFTDGIHPRKPLPHELTDKDDISEATKRAKLVLVKQLIDKFAMDRVLVSTVSRFYE